MLLYYITDRKQFPGDSNEQRRRLLDKIAEAAHAGVNFIQLREKDLSPHDLEQLAREAVASVARENLDRSAHERTFLLINSRVDVALACGADGVHLTSNDIFASEARSLWMRSCPQRPPLIAVSCHSTADVQSAASHGADFAVLAPIFGKIQTGAPGIGMQTLRLASETGSPPDNRVEAGSNRVSVPVFALGGVTAENAAECVESGAAGVAGIRLFQEGVVTTTISALRNAEHVRTR